MSGFKHVVLAAALLASAQAHAGDAVSGPLPPGWTPLQGGATLSGAFRQPGSTDVAVLVRHGGGEAYGLAVVSAAGGKAAGVVKTFSDARANPPSLSLVRPGSYRPVCHDGGDCPPQAIANEAIGLCFGEASCEIIYFRDGVLHELVTTD
jgi:hypothetical protein